MSTRTKETAARGGERMSIGIIMGSDSDLKIMRHVGRALTKLGMEQGIDYEERVVSAHRTPQWMTEYAETLDERGIKVVVAGAGGSAHLPGMVGAFAAETSAIVLGVPITSNPDVMNRSLGAMIGMPEGAPLPVMGQNESGAFNAGLTAFRILALGDPELRQTYKDYIANMKAEVLSKDAALQSMGAQTYLAAQIPENFYL